MWIAETWTQFFFDCKPITIVLMLEREQLTDALIPSSYAPKDTFFIPSVEAWYPNPIPVSTISGYIPIFVPDFNQGIVYHYYDSRREDTFNDLVKCLTGSLSK
jgi:hypothetical protein